ncbi:MAG TPA: hypothetical protein VJR89_43155 [Polyangiales bacterium]|nr:hypothetical protein [Polyangiales bacterium]
MAGGPALPPAAISGTGGFGEQPQLAGTTALAGGPAQETAGKAAPADCGTVTKMADVELGPADIVWIIDGSASMVDELLAVTENITAFANSIGAAGIDHHVIMLGTGDIAADTPLGKDAAHYRFVPSPVDSHNALSLLLDQYADYSSFLRPEAALHFIAISDDESWLAATDFQMQMEQRAGKKFTFHAIASESVNGLPCVGACGLPLVCGGFAPGVQYYALADATGGEKISICISDWSKVFGPLQKAVIESAPLPCDYAIPDPPAGEALDPNKVNLEFSAPNMPMQTFPRATAKDACGDKLAWFYDDPNTPKRIEMCPAGCKAIAAGGTVQIKLGCETVPLIVN